MALDRIEFAGIKSILEMDLPLRSLNVLIGANGSGKSNFIGVFGLLSQLVDGRLQAAVARAGGTPALLHRGLKQTAEIRVRLHFGDEGYQARLAPAQGGGIYFEDESFWLQRDDGPPDVTLLGAGQKETRLSQTRWGLRVVPKDPPRPDGGRGHRRDDPSSEMPPRARLAAEARSALNPRGGLR
jgi:hypothetical protein